MALETLEYTLTGRAGVLERSADPNLPAADENHLYFPGRALSARLVKKIMTEFPAEVLKAGMGLLDGRPVMLNHGYTVGEVTGTVLATWWDDTPILDAPGINARLRVGRAGLPAGLLSQMEADPPLKVPLSVYVRYLAEQSHPDLDRGDFWRLLGREWKGEIVRWIATKIVEMSEISLVWAGADEGARALNRDKQSQPQNEGNDMDKDQNKGASLHARLAGLAGKLGLREADLAAEDDAFVASLEAAADRLGPEAKAGRAHLKARRDEAKRLAGIAHDGNPPEAWNTIIETSDAAAVEALIATLGGKAAEQFSAVCQSCGQPVEIRSSLESATPPATGDDKYAKIGARMAARANGETPGKEG